MNHQMSLLSAGKQNRTVNRSFASRLFSSSNFYACCLLLTFLVTAGFTYKKWWAVTYADTSTASFPTISFLGRVLTGDFDKDGDDDILYQAGTDGAALMFAASNGNGTFAAAVAQNLSPLKNVAAFNIDNRFIHVKDFDKDGDMDLWIAVGNATGTYLRNDNGLYSSQSSASFPAPQFPGRPVSGDFDNDGDPDILYQVGADGSAFQYARNNGDATFTIVAVASSPFSGLALANMTTAITIVADYDHDGDQDLWVPVGTTSGRYYQNNGSSFSEPSSAAFPAPNFPARVKVGDYDNDGDPDILYQTDVDGSAFGYYQNNGNGTFTNTGIAGSPLNGLTLPNLIGTNYNLPDFDNDGDIDIYTTANGTQGTYFVQQGAVNAAPVINAPATITVSEDYINAPTGISFSDADAGTGSVTVSLSVPSGTLGGNSGSGVTVTGAGTNALSLAGSITDINAFIAASNLRYITAANATANVTLTIGINDNGNTGAGGAKTASGTVTLVVTAVNDAPALNVPATFNVTEDQATALTGISFSDIDAGGSSVTVGFFAPVGAGTLAATSGGGVTIAGAGTNALSLAGSIANINAFIAASSVTYTTAANGSGGLTLSVTIIDNGNTGTGGSQSTSGTIALTITATNDSPVITVPASINVTEDLATALTGISFTDVDAGAASVTVSLTVASGTLAATSGSGVTVSGAGTNALALSGSIANINAFIAASNVSYTTVLNGTSNIAMGVDINDLGNSGNGGSKTASNIVPLTVSAVNDAPVNTVPGLQQTDMDTDLTFDTGHGNRISFGDVDVVTPGVTQLEVTLTATNGTISLGSRIGLVFSTGDGIADATMTFTGSQTYLIVALSQIVFSPTYGHSGTASLQIITSDLGNIGTGGVKTDTDIIPITVIATNPKITTVHSTNVNGAYNTGDVIDITVQFDQSVTVTGSPQLLLETGTTDRPATYLGGSGSSTLTFRYIVQAGDLVADLDYASTSALTLNGGTLRSGTNDDAILTLPTVGGANSLGAQHDISIDGIIPQVTSVTPPLAGTYIASQSLDLMVNYGEIVMVNTTGGTPYVNIVVGGSFKQARYMGGSGTNTLTFRYIVQPGDLQPTGIGVDNSIQTNGGTLQDPAGNTASVVLQNIGNTFGVRIDAVVPTVAISSTAANPVNQSFTITITFSEAVTGFTIADLTGSNCIVSAFTVIDPQTYTALVTPASNGAVSIDIAAGVAQDLATNPNTASNTLSRVFDNIPVSVVVSSPAPNIVNNAFTTTFTFSEDVNDFTTADITVGNATISNFTVLDPKTYTALITPANEGSVSVSVPANKATDAAGNANNPSNTLNRIFDASAPSVTISTTAVGPVNQPFTITITFSEAVTGFVQGDLTVGNGTVSNLQTTDNITYSALITPTTDGQVTVQLPAAAAIDVAGNNNTVSNQLIMFNDITAPTVTLSKTIGAATNAPFTVSIQFSEVVNGFVAADLALTNATAGNLQTTDNKNYTVLITPVVDGPVTVAVPAGIAADQATNPNTASATLSVLYDVTKPTVVITTIATDPVQAPFNITITFSEATTDFTATDITAVNGTVSNFATLDAQTYTVLITPVSDGNVSVSVAANQATDPVGNGNTVSNTLIRAFDGTPPSVTISTTAVSPVNQPFTIELVFSEAVTGLTAGELSIGNGTVSNLQTTDNIAYTALITPTTDGPVTVQLPAGAAIDVAGNDNSVSNQLVLTNDITPPTVTLSKTVGAATNAPFTVTIQFSEVVNGFVAPDLALTNATASNLQTSDNKNFSVLITPANEGNVTVTVPAGIATDQATNLNAASAALSVLYDITRPTVSISTTAADPIKAPFDITITFSEAVNGFNANDLAVVKATISNLQTNDNITYTATVQPTAEGVVSVTVKQAGATDPGGNTNTASSTLIRYFDISAPVITVSARNVALNIVTAPFTAVFRSAEKIQGLTLAEIVVTNGIASNLVQESDFVYTATITPAYARELVTVQLPAGTVEDLAGNLNALSNKYSVMVYGSAKIVKLYPVPTRGPLTILFDGILEKKTRIMVMDMAGRIFYTRDYQMTSQQLQLNFTGLMPVGLYHLVVINDGYIERRNIVIAP